MERTPAEEVVRFLKPIVRSDDSCVEHESCELDVPACPLAKIIRQKLVDLKLMKL